MYIVFSPGLPDETVCVEDKKEAIEIATQLAKEHTTPIGVYKSTLVAQTEIGVYLKKIKTQRSKVTSPVVKTAKKLNELVKPPLDPILKSIAEDPEGAQDDVFDKDAVPLGARCALDMNIAVGRKKGPTGEWVYLCINCMGEVDKNA